MKEFYDPKIIEPKVQLNWKKMETFKVKEDHSKQKFYCLSMMPYPSGNLHIGHVRNYTIGDVISRYQRMLGKNVLQPIGWDAFGLPAEKAAIKNNILPSCWTYSNIKYMKKILKLLGLSYDWSREIITCKPEYYKWEQWFFIELYNKGLAYKRKEFVNWCTKDQTVLANEQVINNKCWRCDTKIKKKKIPQWFIKITNYADELFYDLENLHQWPKKIITMQKNWIGRSEGIEFDFFIIEIKEVLKVYTTRPDLIMGVTYLMISIDHPLSLKIKNTNNELTKFIKLFDHYKLTESEISTIGKKGIESGLHAIHPITKKMLPIWIVNFILPNEKNFSVMCVPAHNQQDWEFAFKYNLPIKKVILNQDNNEPNTTFKAMTRKGKLFNSGIFNGLDFLSSFKKIADFVKEKKIGQYKVCYRIQDWCISRQRYWGVPIPMITLQDGSIFPVPSNQLPIILPENISMKENIINPLKIDSNWFRTTYKDQLAIRETDTFDTFMESSWYYARYTCPNNHDSMLKYSSANYWLPVDQYIGGIEHATMHLIYFRFYHKLLRDSGLLSSSEPVKKLLCQGMVVTDTFYYYSNVGEKIWVSPEQVITKRNKQGYIISATDCLGNKLIYDGLKKMSKSKNNGIDPYSIINKYGADTIRLFIMFSAPPEMTLQWKENGLIGSNRFLKKLWNMVYKYSFLEKCEKVNTEFLNENQKLMRNEIHQTIKKVTDDIDRRQMFNTAISSIMKLVNKMICFVCKNKQDHSILKEGLVVIIKMLYPFTPHICFFLWQKISKKGKSIDYESWPIVDNKAIIEDPLVIVQINGKLREKIFISKEKKEKKQVMRYALKSDIIKKFLNNKKIKKVIYIPNKLLNFVVE